MLKLVITYTAKYFMQVFGRIVVIIVEYEMSKHLHNPYVGHEIGH